MAYRRVEPYWLVIGVLLVVMTIVFVAHVATGWMPDNVALTIGLIDLDVYWYGIVIMGGVALGCYVVARLATERARQLFDAAVSAETQRQSLATLDLPPDLDAALRKNKLTTVGDLLFEYGLAPRRTGLSKQGVAQLKDALHAAESIDNAWLDAPAWRQWNPDHVWSGVIWCILFGVIGARLYHVFTPSPSMAALGIESPADYFRNPLQLINIRNGGLGIYGGILGGLLGLLLYTWRARISWVRWGDLAVVGLALGQFVGRWGNFLNQELYGRPTNAPWGITIDNPLQGYEAYTTFHPAFLYESIWNLMAFGVLYYLARNRTAHLLPGDLIASYLIFYGIGRILLETVRLDSRAVAVGALAIPTASLVSAAIILVMVGLLLVRHRPAR